MNFKGARKIHDYMIHKVMRAPINLFFDVTPTGTIMNRFSKDLNLLDGGTSITFGGINVLGY